jgi:predicted dehydrogenase
VTKVDLVDIITPPRAHLEPVLTTLAACKPVLCEKPLVIDVAEAADMAVAARKAALVTATSFSRRFDAVVRYVRELVGGGHIGEHRMTTVQLLRRGKPTPRKTRASTVAG